MYSSRDELDIARCRAQWSNIPNLAYRFKRMHPNESVLEKTANLEVQLIQLVNQVRNQHYSQQDDSPTNILDTIHYQDTPHQVALSIRLSVTQVASIQHELENIVQNYNKATLTTTNDRQAQLTRIILARVYFESGQYEKALDTLQNVALRLEDVETGYGFVLLIQARVIKGFCYELTGQEKHASDTFEAVWDAIEGHLNETGPVLAYWAEEGLYRAIMLSLRTGASVDLTFKFMRAYSQLSSSHWSSQWRNQKRWIIFKLYTDYLINTYVDETYPVNQIETTKQQAAFQELFVLMNRCRAVIRSYASSKLAPGIINNYVVEFVNIMTRAHDVIGWGEISHIRRVQQFLYHVESLTFNSPCILRLLFYTLLRLGQFEEAKYAFRTYMELVGSSDKTNDDNESIPLANKVAMIKAKLKRMQLEKTDNDSAQPYNETLLHVIRILLAATQLWGREYNQGNRAVMMADLAVALADTMDDDDSDGGSHIRGDSDGDAIVVECHRARGVSYGLLASQSQVPELRSQHQKEAIMSLEIAVTLDSTSWESHYELAYQQLQARDLLSASDSITRSLQLNKLHLPSWHLLALLYSCPQVEKLPEALQTLELAIGETQIMDDIINLSTTGLPVMSWTGEKNCRDVLVAAESVINIHLSQLACMARLDGPDTVLTELADLFALYNVMTKHLGITDTLEMEQQLFSTTLPATTTTAYPRNGRKVSRPEIRSITTINSPVNRNGQRTQQQMTPPSSLDELEEPGTPSPSSKEDFELASFVRRRRSGGSLTSFSSDPALIENIKSHTPTTTPTPVVYNGLPELKVNVVRRGSQSLKKSLHYMESRGTSKPETPSTPKTNGTPTSNFSLASLLTPSLSMASMRSHTTDRSSSYVSAFGTSSQTTTNDFIFRQRDRWNALLMKLWLFATKTYLQADQLDEAKKALMEMETLGAGEPDTWHQMGKIYGGLEAFKKALTLDEDHADTHIDMADVFMQLGEWEMAESLLERTTRSWGWDHARAWYLLGLVHQQYKSLGRAKVCFLYALELEETCPITSPRLPRFVA
ncbi:hypothetical protein BC941DRAFT_497775 [Chlamydoabsidia padenii]|nr:hypothetical protein BC941DRAFT_497775 [Chlamydoabsidia padenii]